MPTLSFVLFSRWSFLLSFSLSLLKWGGCGGLRLIWSQKYFQLHLLFQIGFQDDNGNVSTYEDRTSRFFPPTPTVPRMPGVVAGDTGYMDDNESSFRDLSNSSQQRFNILCSGDKDGSICFSIFGIFPIGKIVSYYLSLKLLLNHAE